jgi:hypothetical protein
LLVTSSSRVHLNGVARNPIKNGRNLRQRNLLLPLLFVFAIDSLTKILELATLHGPLLKIRRCDTILRTSLSMQMMWLFLWLR